MGEDQRAAWYERRMAHARLTENERRQLNLKATSWVGEQFLDALDNGECDLVLCYWHPDLPWGDRLASDKFQWQTIGREALVPVSIANEQGEPRYRLPGTDEQPVPLIAYHSRGFLQSAIDGHLQRGKLPANLLPLNENTQSASIKALVKQGFGRSFSTFSSSSLSLIYFF